MSNRQQRRLQQKSLKKKGSKAARGLVTTDNLDSALRAAVQYHQDGKLRQAETLYLQVLQIAPDNVDALNGMGMLAFSAKKYTKALNMLGKVLAAAPDNPGYHMNIGAVQDAAGKSDDAENSYRRAIELRPDYLDPYHNLGDLYLKLDRPIDAIAVFDACMDSNGREFHSLAYKAHAFDDAGQHDNARDLLDFDRFVKTYAFEPPKGYDTLTAFNDALARHIKTHPTLQGGVMSTENGKHTGELLRAPKGPMGAMEARIDEAIRWYIDNLPDDPDHPAVKWAPSEWKLTSWGVVMHNKGHERAHIHPNGWLSGVFYLSLPDVLNDPDRQPEGWLEFGRPTADLHVKSELTVRHYKPEYGQMFLFPSYFYHGTIPFKSEQRRICVSFDVEPLY
jgi:tetratricopeptide (TPR) repeat protein